MSSTRGRIALAVAVTSGLSMGVAIGTVGTTIMARKRLSEICGTSTIANFTDDQLSLFGAIPTVGGALVSMAVALAAAYDDKQAPTPRAGILAVWSFIGFLAGLGLIGMPDEAFLILLLCKTTCGMAVGAIASLAPNIVDHLAPASHKVRYGLSFQVCVTIGILLSTTLYFAVDLHHHESTCSSYKLLISIIAIHCPVTFALLFIASLLAYRHEGEGPVSLLTVNEEDAPAAPPRSNIRLLLSAIALPVAIQLTGINAIVFYTSIIADSIGIPSATANVALMAWNCVTAVAGIFIGSRMELRNTLLAGLAGLVVSNVILACSIAPRFDSKIGVCLGTIFFVMSFEMGVAVAYYPLTTRLFANAKSISRLTGAALIITLESALSVLTAFLFPLAAGSFSDKNTGESVAFGAFAIMGALAWAVLYGTLCDHAAGTKV